MRCRCLVALVPVLVLLSVGAADAQITLPWTEGFESTLSQEVRVDTPSLTGAPEWSFETDAPGAGRLRTGTSGYPRSGLRGATLDREPNGGLVQNYLIVTLDLSAYDVIADNVRLDFSHLSHGDESGSGDRVWARGSDTDPWVEVYNLTADAGSGTWFDVTNVAIASWLDTAGQAFSSTTQIRFGQWDNGTAISLTGYDGRSIDDVQVKLVVPQDAGVTAILTPFSGQCGLSTDVIDVQVTNLGSSTISNVPVSVVVTGIANGTLTGTAVGPLAAGESEVVSLSPVDLFSGGTVTMDATTTWALDQQAANDPLSASAAILGTEIDVAPPPPVCPGNPTTLVAVAEQDTMFGWYEPGGTLMGLGDTYTVAALTSTQTWGVLRETQADSVGPADPSIGNLQAYTSTSQGLVFDVLLPSTLVSVDVYPTNAGTVVVNLEDAGGALLATTSAVVLGGGLAETIPLGFDVPVGVDYTLDAWGTEAAVGGMVRNYNGASYPYADSIGAVEITGTINNLATYYYFFYDWQIETLAECADEQTSILAATDVAVCAVDLGLGLTGPSAATAGTSSVFDLVVTNSGADYAPSVTLDLPIPSGASFLGNTGDCATSFPCALGDVPAGSSRTVSTSLSSALAGTMTLNATVASAGNETAAGDEAASLVVTIIGQADLSATGVAPSAVAAGGSGTFTVTVANNGASQAEGATLALSAGLGIVATVTSGCSEDPAGVPVCSLASIPEGGTASVTLDVMVAPTAAGAITLTGVASSSTADTNPGDESVTLTAPVDRTVDLVAGLTAAPEPVVAGASLSWTLSATNGGPADATGVTGTFTPPAGAVLGPLPAECAASTGTVVCTWGGLAVGASDTSVLVADVDPATVGTLVGALVVAGTETEAAPGDETASVTSAVNAAADLQIVGSATPDPVTAGDNGTWTFDVVNVGPSDATGVTLALALDADLTLVSTAGCAEDPSGAPTCTLGTLPSGGGATVVVAATVAGSALGLVGIEATVSGATAEAAPGDETADIDLAVDAATDLSVALAASPDPVTAGQTLSYTLAVGNAGPSEASNVVVAVLLPVTVAVATVPPECVAVAYGLECAWPTLAAAGSATLTFDGAVAPVAIGTLSHEAVVSGDQPEAAPGDETAVVDVIAATAADLSVSIESVTADPLQGGAVVWVARVANGGPSVARDLALDSVFAGDVAVDGTIGCAEDPTGTPLCSVADALAPGAALTIVVESTVPSAGQGEISGTFTASMSTPESNVGDEVDTATVTIVVEGDDDDSAGDDDDATGDDDDATGDDDDATGDDDDATGDDDDATGDDDDTTGADDEPAPECGCAASGGEAPGALGLLVVLVGGVLARRRRSQEKPGEVL